VTDDLRTSGVHRRGDVAPPRRRKSWWRRLRRATRGPRNAIIARTLDAAARAFGALPVDAGLRVGRGLGLAAHRLLAAPRRLALEHVRLAFPELDERARRGLVRATFAHAGESFVELALWPKLEHRDDFIVAEGLGLADAAVAEGRGCIAVTGHTGNWELLAAALGARYPLTVVARRVNDTRFDALVVRFRKAVGIEVLARDVPDLLVRIRAALANGRVVAFLIDQDTRASGVFVPFFGRPAHTPAGAAVLALRARVPVLTAFIERRAEGGHRIRVANVPLTVDATPTGGRTSVVELTARLTAAIEAQIRRAPAEWVWWHERWRRQPARPSPLQGGRPRGT
jgi:KDO2-lipid IV(A) lauroyltransferase